ncbi:hypothetical protein V1478_016976 [Vespula squamosa]|uniref:Uncharacterized protein n=1 Tax=Vespula squamosa TaxID=30214 RepID=A0ABD1ZY29_VESSQ
MLKLFRDVITLISVDQENSKKKETCMQLQTNFALNINSTGISYILILTCTRIHRKNNISVLQFIIKFRIGHLTGFDTISNNIEIKLKKQKRSFFWSRTKKTEVLIKKYIPESYQKCNGSQKEKKENPLTLALSIYFSFPILHKWRWWKRLVDGGGGEEEEEEEEEEEGEEEEGEGEGGGEVCV